MSHFEVAGRWWVNVPEEQWPKDAESLRYIMRYWLDDIGDSRQELVFIGMGMDEMRIREQLSAALLTPQEMAYPASFWTAQPDPFA